MTAHVEHLVGGAGGIVAAAGAELVRRRHSSTALGAEPVLVGHAASLSLSRLNWLGRTGSGKSRGKHGGHLASASTQAGFFGLVVRPLEGVTKPKTWRVSKSWG